MSATQTATASAPAATGEQRFELDVTGMTCGSCAARIQRALSREPGVREALVNYATGRATVSLQAGAGDAGGLLAAVARAGYAATPVAAGPAAHAHVFAEQDARRAPRPARAGAAHRPRSPAGDRDHRPHARRPARADGALDLRRPRRPRPVLVRLAVPALSLAAGPRTRHQHGHADRAQHARELGYSSYMLLSASAVYDHGVAVGRFNMPLDYDIGGDHLVAALLIARWTEAKARRRAGRAIRELAALGATQARLTDRIHRLPHVFQTSENWLSAPGRRPRGSRAGVRWHRRRRHRPWRRANPGRR